MHVKKGKAMEPLGLRLKTKYCMAAETSELLLRL